MFSAEFNWRDLIIRKINKQLHKLPKKTADATKDVHIQANSTKLHLHASSFFVV